MCNFTDEHPEQGGQIPTTILILPTSRKPGHTGSSFLLRFLNIHFKFHNSNEIFSSYSLNFLNGTNFTPDWPASCPWVTMVGGTQVKPSAAASNSPSTPSGSGKIKVWNQDLTGGFFVSSGGGFSNRFPSPAYQRSAVQGYLRVASGHH